MSKKTQTKKSAALPSEEQSISPGSLLRKTREEQRITVEQVAEYLRLPHRNIEALEADRYQELPDKPFVMGYLRAYSRLLDIDGELVIGHYHAYLGEPDNSLGAVRSTIAADAVQVPGISKVQAFLKKRVYWIIGGLLLIWIVSASFLGSNDEQVWQGEAPPAIVPAPEEAVTDDKDDVAVSDEVKTISEETQESNLSQVESANLAPAAIAEQPSVKSLDSLSFEFSGECWLEVTDSKGDVVAVNLYQAGESVTVEGVAPFSVNLGNFKAVQVVLNGKPVELQSKGRGKTLRVSIGEKIEIGFCYVF